MSPTRGVPAFLPLLLLACCAFMKRLPEAHSFSVSSSSRHHSRSNCYKKEADGTRRDMTNVQDDDPLILATTTTVGKLSEEDDPFSFLSEDTQSQCQALVHRVWNQTLSHDATNHQQYWIAIAGGPGSGKTTLASYIQHLFDQTIHESSSTVVIPMDGWHIPLMELKEQFGLPGVQRRGAPWTFDVAALVDDLTKAKSTGQASLPIYSRERHDPVPDGVQLLPSHRIVLVEGLYLLHREEDTDWNRLQGLWDETWYIQGPKSREAQIERLISRSLVTWNEDKTVLWGAGREGAKKRAEANDVLNMDLVAQTKPYANHTIINE